MLGLSLLLLFIDGISNVNLEGCVRSTFADDVIKYAYADSVELMKYKLEICMNSIKTGIQMTASESITRNTVSR